MTKPIQSKIIKEIRLSPVLKWADRKEQRLSNLRNYISLFKPLIFSMLSLLIVVGCSKKDSKTILMGKTFYYIEPCKEETYCKNIFTKDSIIEMEFEKDTQVSTYRIPIQYYEEGIIVQDGEKLFPCFVSNKKKYIGMHCKYDEERGVQILWRTLEDAKSYKPECQKAEKEEV